MLLRVFCNVGGHHSAEEFQGQLPSETEMQIYTWPDATLKELSNLIKGVKQAARQPDARLSFAFVYPDKSGKNTVRKVGMTQGSRRTADDQRSLQSLAFEIGDYLDVAVLVR